MQHTLKRLPKSTVEILVELTPEDMQPYLQKAATHLGQETAIPGFRPGKAPYDQVVARFGAQRIWEEAAQIAVPKIYSAVVAEEKLETIGSPEIAVEKLAADNPFIFKATAPLLPEITLGDYASITIEPKPVTVKEEHVDKVLRDLQKTQTKEVVVDRPAQSKSDKVVLDLAMSLDTVPLDGGTTKDHAVYMDEAYYVPGFKEQLPGLKKGDTKEFQLKFPKEHYQKMIAGKDVDFKIEVKEVFELTAPALDDEFAKMVGQESIAGLRGLVQSNLEQEATQKETERRELAFIEEAVARTKFSDIPDILINEETHKMLGEMEDGAVRQGLEFTEYLNKISKTRDQLRLDFAADAVKRVKTALLLRALATEKQIAVSEPEIDAEVERVLGLYKDAPEQHEHIRSPGARQYLSGMLRNRKTIQWLLVQVKQ